MDKRIGLEIRIAQQMINQKIEKDRVHENISLTHIQMRVLHYISKQTNPVYQKDIEDYLNVRRSTVTEMFNILERDGYITRKRAKHDGRLREIIITNKTEEVVSEMKSYLDQFEKLLIKDIDEDDLKVFYKVLDQIKENIK